MALGRRCDIGCETWPDHLSSRFLRPKPSGLQDPVQHVGARDLDAAGAVHEPARLVPATEDADHRLHPRAHELTDFLAGEIHLYRYRSCPQWTDEAHDQINHESDEPSR